MYLTKTERTRQAIADAMYLDMTTVKRRADKCLDQLMHYLIGTYVNLEKLTNISTNTERGAGGFGSTGKN